jgi:hypothetical protein
VSRTARGPSGAGAADTFETIKDVLDWGIGNLSDAATMIGFALLVDVVGPALEPGAGFVIFTHH